MSYEQQARIGQAINITKDIILHNWQGYQIPVDVFCKELLDKSSDILFILNHLDRIQSDSLRALNLSDQVTQQNQQVQQVNNQNGVVPPPQINQGGYQK